MPEETALVSPLTPVPGRIAKALYDWADGLSKDSLQPPVLLALADALNDIRGMMGKPSLEVVAAYCLRTHDQLTDVLESALKRPLHATYSSNDEATPLDDRDNGYYANDSRLEAILEVILSDRDADEATWHLPVRRGLNCVCIGRKKDDPVKTLIEIVIAFVDRLAISNGSDWGNKSDKAFVTLTQDGVRTALNGTDKPPQASRDYDTLQTQVVDLRRQVSALQDDFARRLAGAEADKRTAVEAVRKELEPQINEAVDARDRASARTLELQAENQRLSSLADSYDELFAEHQALKTATEGSDEAQTTKVLSSLREQLADVTRQLHLSEQAREDEAELNRKRTVELDEAHQEIDRLSSGDTAGARDPVSIPIHELPTPDAELLSALANLHEMVAQIGSLIVKRATHTS